MRIQIYSDLHFESLRKNEFFELDVETTNPDVVVLAGDIVPGGLRTIEWAKRYLPGRDVIYVFGNHEGYGRNYDDVVQKVRQATQDDDKFHFLYDDEIVIKGVRFLGTPLWTDFCLFGEARRQEAMRAVARKTFPDENGKIQMMEDYRAIRLASKNYRRLTPADTAQFHAKHRGWLRGKLDTHFDGPTVVVTHMAPSMQSIPIEHREDIFSAAYASNLDALVEKCDLWVHGHLHQNMDYRIGKGRVICNPAGYTDKTGNRHNQNFRRDFVVDI